MSLAQQFPLSRLADFGFLLPFLSGLLVSVVFLYVLHSTKKVPAPAVHPTEWRRFTLVKKTPVSPNTALYRFALAEPTDILGLPIGQHISVRADIGGKKVMRSYTPVSSDDDAGFFELLVKSYPNGNVSKFIGEMQVGEKLEVRGPKGTFRYEQNMCRAIGMIAGGTGITPMLQIVRHILKDPLDKTELSLIFANVAEEDILLRSEINKLYKNHKDRFRAYYVLNNAPKDWKGGVGFVTRDMIEKHCPAPASDAKMLLCGPPPMITAMCGHLEAIGWEKPGTISKPTDAVYKF
ncbi:hypothetical protein GQ42DRAFT_160923 [Ramicandelaber brevisporus]|nr:hypothetical protein GQ42DRAFT_160923 [Ramicandelaber brevisporus]